MKTSAKHFGRAIGP